ncbi:MAG: CHAT domain-containing protein, partial [Candidatus Eisenbacteria bacterium]|nr:CHAT domain-containing protein [Candidatus Eisenbacteria bacterium]
MPAHMNLVVSRNRESGDYATLLVLPDGAVAGPVKWVTSARRREIMLELQACISSAIWSVRGLDSVDTAVRSPALPLMGVGKTLFLEFVGNDYGRYLEGNGGPLCIRVDDEGSQGIPWELLHDGDDYLSLHRPVVRDPQTDNAPDNRTAPSVMFFGSDPRHDISSTEEALSLHRKVRRLLGEGHAWCCTMPQSCNRSKVEAVLGDPSFHVVHFAGHVEPDPQNPGRYGLLLCGEDGEALLHSDQMAEALRLRKGKNGPLVFINGCSSAHSEDEANREAAQALEGRTRSLALACLEGGACGVVGTLWAVEDGVAQAFAEVFYDRLFRGATVADSLLAARQAAKERDSKGHTWASFVYYGDPDMRLVADGKGAEPRSSVLVRALRWLSAFWEKVRSKRWLGAMAVLVSLLCLAIGLIRWLPSELTPMALTDFEPREACPSDSFQVEVRGTGFSRSCDVRLTHPELDTLVASQVEVVNPGLLRATFALQGAAPGPRKVVVSKLLRNMAESGPSSPFQIRDCELRVGWAYDEGSVRLTIYSGRILEEGSIAEVYIESDDEQKGAVRLYAVTRHLVSRAQAQAVIGHVMPGIWDVVVVWDDGTEERVS